MALEKGALLQIGQNKTKKDIRTTKGFATNSIATNGFQLEMLSKQM